MLPLAEAHGNLTNNMCNINCKVEVEEGGLCPNASVNFTNPASAAPVAASIAGLATYFCILLLFFEIKSRKSVNSSRVNKLFIVPAAALTFMTWTNVIELLGGKMGGVACDVLDVTRTILFIVTLNCVIYILWKRQHKFYVDDRFGLSHKKRLACFSYFLVAVIWTSNTTIPLLVKNMHFSESSQTGCVIFWGKQSTALIVILALFFVILASAQTAFLWLVVWPLRQNSAVPLREDLRSMVRRLAAVTGFSILVGSASPVNVYLHSNSLACELHIPNTMAIDLLLCNLALVATRTRWKEIFIPCLAQKPVRLRNASSLPMISTRFSLKDRIEFSRNGNRKSLRNGYLTQTENEIRTNT